jgi:predicted butyrate kinase (DUF1464 family)
MLALGIALGASGWRAALWDEDRAAQLHAPADPAGLWALLEDVTAAHRGMPCVLPSGLGVPLTRARDILDRDVFEMTFRGERGSDELLAAFLPLARHRLPTAFCIPGVKALATVPLPRKLFRVDLGGAGLVCAAAWALHVLGRSGRAESFLLLHLEAGLRGMAAVCAGQIVDGVGSSVATFGQDGDGDAAEPLRLSGPAAWWRREGARVAQAEAHSPGCVASARWDGVRREVFALAGAYGLDRVVVTGEERAEALDLLAGRIPCESLPAPADGYEPALGAAVVAAGLTGGPTTPLLDRLGLREARGRVLDYLRP